MDEILYELRDYGCALNAGRWDYIFSTIKKLGAVLPDRGSDHDDGPVHARLHRTAKYAFLPSARRARDRRHGGRSFPSLKRSRLQRSRPCEGFRGQDDESRAGFDGTWVAHPDLVPVARDCSTSVLGDRPTSSSGSARTSTSPRATPRLRCSGWHDHRRRPPRKRFGRRALPRRLAPRIGAAAIDNLMEDTATAEIAAPRSGAGSKQDASRANRSPRNSSASTSHPKRRHCSLRSRSRRRASSS